MRSNPKYHFRDDPEKRIRTWRKAVEGVNHRYGDPIAVISILRSEVNLEDMVRSVASQSYPNVEWTVVNRAGLNAAEVLEAIRKLVPGLKLTVLTGTKSEIEVARKIPCKRLAFLPERVRWEQGHLEALARSGITVPCCRFSYTVVGRGWEFRRPPSIRNRAVTPDKLAICALWPTRAFSFRSLRTSRFRNLTSLAQEAKDSLPYGLLRSTSHYTVRFVEVEDK